MLVAQFMSIYYHPRTLVLPAILSRYGALCKAFLPFIMKNATYFEPANIGMYGKMERVILIHRNRLTHILGHIGVHSVIFNAQAI